METYLGSMANEHLVRYDLINYRQHKFRQGRSCLTNLLQYLEVITATIHSNSIHKVQLDFKKTLQMYHLLLTDILNNHIMGRKIG